MNFFLEAEAEAESGVKPIASNTLVARVAGVAEHIKEVDTRVATIQEWLKKSECKSKRRGKDAKVSLIKEQERN